MFVFSFRDKNPPSKTNTKIQEKVGIYLTIFLYYYVRHISQNFCFTTSSDTASLIPTIGPTIPVASLSRRSTPPLTPEDAVGRVVLFGHTWSNSRSSRLKTTAATLYKQHVAPKRKASNAYNKKLKEAKENKKTLNIRKVNTVKLFSKLTKEEKAVFQKRAEEEISYDYFVIGKCTRVPAPSAAASSSARGTFLSRKSNILESAELKLSHIKQGDIPAILTLFVSRNPNLEASLQIQ
jgi:hypothetical protein